MSNLREQIVATLAYYDVLGIPLTAAEVGAYLIRFDHERKLPDQGAPDAIAVQLELDRLVSENLVGTREDYYFLFDREYLVPLRIKRHAIWKVKERRARRVMRWLYLVPFVQAVFSSGSLALQNTHELSDLDVLIVTRHDHIWLARWGVVVMLTLLGVRRRPTDRVAPDTICANHYITDQSLHIPIMSMYTAHTYAHMQPLFMKQKYAKDFVAANTWVGGYVSNWSISDNAVYQPNLWWRTLSRMLELVFDNALGRVLEGIARRDQTKRIEKNPITHMHPTEIHYSDRALVFQPNSREAHIVDLFNLTLQKVGLGDFAIEKPSAFTSRHT